MPTKVNRHLKEHTKATLRINIKKVREKEIPQKIVRMCFIKKSML
jgi:hypothetical protein